MEWIHGRPSPLGADYEQKELARILDAAARRRQRRKLAQEVVDSAWMLVNYDAATPSGKIARQLLREDLESLKAHDDAS